MVFSRGNNVNTNIGNEIIGELMVKLPPERLPWEYWEEKYLLELVFRYGFKTAEAIDLLGWLIPRFDADAWHTCMANRREALQKRLEERRRTGLGQRSQ